MTAKAKKPDWHPVPQILGHYYDQASDNIDDPICRMVAMKYLEAAAADLGYLIRPEWRGETVTSAEIEEHGLPT